MENHHFIWVNHHCKWQFSIAFCMFTYIKNSHSKNCNEPILPQLTLDHLPVLQQSPWQRTDRRFHSPKAGGSHASGYAQRGHLAVKNMRVKWWNAQKIQSLNLHVSNPSATSHVRLRQASTVERTTWRLVNHHRPSSRVQRSKKVSISWTPWPDIGDTKILPHTHTKKNAMDFQVGFHHLVSQMGSIPQNVNSYENIMVTHMALVSFKIWDDPPVIDTFLPQLFSSYRFSRTLPANSEPNKNRSWPVPEKHPDPCNSNQRFWSLQSLWKTGWSWPVPPERPRRSPPFLSDLPWNTQLQAVHCLSSVTFKVMQQSKSHQNMWKTSLNSVSRRPLPAPATDGVQPSWVPPNMAHGPKKTSVPANVKKGGRTLTRPKMGMDQAN